MRIRTPLLRAVSTATLLTALAAPSPSPAAASATTTAPAASTAAAADTRADTAAATAARCPWTWRVRRANAPVYELPRSDQRPLKRKRRGAVVRGNFCIRYRNTSENRVYITVSTRSAQDGIGWMRRGDLTRIH